MWPDDRELTAPAIVISSLGGLVHGKDSLTPKDAYRACVLRKALKKQLGRPRGPRRRGPGGMEHDLASEIIHHRVLPLAGGGTDASDTNSLCSHTEDSRRSHCCALSSSIPRARVNTKLPPSNNSEAAASQKRGWRVQGQIAGEWRDRLGRHRRARPTENANTNAIAASGSGPAADLSRISSLPNSSSCAGSEVSFEGLVDELRERLPRSSLLAKFVGSQRQNGTVVCPGVEAMVTGAVSCSLDHHQEEDPLRKRRQIGESSRSEHERGEEAKGAMPPGCLRLRHPLVGPMRANANSQPLLRQNGQRLSSAAGVGPQPSLVMPPGGMLFSDGSAYRLVAMEAVDSENASPSAAMVAAAKAQERALPLLQVCAVKVSESPSS
eukprot:g15122.t1